MIIRRLGSVGSRNTLGTVGASLIGQIAQLVSGVASARLLGPTLRGDLAFLSIVPNVAAQVAHLGVPSAVAYFTARRPRDYSGIAKAGIRLTFIPALAGGLGSSLIVALTGYAGTDWPIIILITSAFVPTSVIQLVALSSLNGRQRFLAFNVQRVLPIVLNATALAALLVLHIPSVVLALVALLVSQAVSTAASLVSTRAVEGDLSTDERGVLLRFGLKSLPATWSPVETFRLDQFVVGIGLGTPTLGFYAAAAAFSVLPRLISQAVAMAGYPMIVAQKTNADMTRTALLVITSASALVIIITVSLEVMLPQITEVFFGTAFLPAVDVARILLPAAAFMSFRRVMAESSRALGRPELDSLSEVSSWPVLAAALLVLTPLLGAVGVALSILLAYVTATMIAALLLGRALVSGQFGRVATGQ
ncbi:MAG TPA: oligosaccharide flippase family protein [Mycobacterium sp.]|nr:oligosaccharide flippase family protein [Mycobacterium sp.]